MSSPDDPRPRLYLCRGEPWSWVLCLPARILGSRAGVARQAFHSALWCFDFGAKRAPQMRWYCHSSNLSPQEFQRWAARGCSWSAALSHVTVCNTLIFQVDLWICCHCFAQNTVWDLNICTFICAFSHLYGQHDVHGKLKAENHIFVRRWRKKLSSKTSLLFFFSISKCVLTSSPKGSRSRDERRRGASSQVSKNHFYTQTWWWLMWKVKKFNSEQSVVFRREFPCIWSYND